MAATRMIAITGCSGASNEIVIEYSMAVKGHEKIPDDVIGHPNPEGFSWVVVQFELVSGSFDAADIMGLTQVEVGGMNHFTRAVKITSPDSKLLTSSNGSYAMEEGTQGKAYYRTSEESENPEWVVKQLRNQHGSVEIQKQ